MPVINNVRAQTSFQIDETLELVVAPTIHVGLVAPNPA